MGEAEVDGVDWASVDIPREVARIMGGQSFGGSHRDDMHPVDALIRAWQGLKRHSDLRDAIGVEAAKAAKGPEMTHRSYALAFFSRCPNAAGGEVFAEIAIDGASGYPSTVANSLSGVSGETMKEALLYTAIDWRSGEAVTPALLQEAQEDAQTGDGGSLISPLARHAPEWFTKHSATLLALYPNKVGAVWDGLVEAGADPMETAKTVIANADAKGKKSLSAYVRFSDRVDSATRSAIVAMCA